TGAEDSCLPPSAPEDRCAGYPVYRDFVGRQGSVRHGIQRRDIPSRPGSVLTIMKAVCLVVQNVYDIDPRVRRKAEALVAAGYSVDVLALRAPNGSKTYSVNGVNVRTVS